MQQKVEMIDFSLTCDEFFHEQKSFSISISTNQWPM